LNPQDSYYIPRNFPEVPEAAPRNASRIRAIRNIIFHRIPRITLKRDDEMEKKIFALTSSESAVEEDLYPFKL